MSYSSITIHICWFFSKASYSCRTLVWCRVVCSSISLCTASLSVSQCTAINLAANFRLVLFSWHFFTSPNFPLKIYYVRSEEAETTIPIEYNKYLSPMFCLGWTGKRIFRIYILYEISEILTGVQEGMQMIS